MFYNSCLVALMPSGGTLGRTGTAWSPDIAQRQLARQQLIQDRPYIFPCPHILRFFLHPNHFAQLRIMVEDTSHLFDWKWIKLLNAGDGDLRTSLAFFICDHININLAA